MDRRSVFGALLLSLSLGLVALGCGHSHHSSGGGGNNGPNNNGPSPSPSPSPAPSPSPSPGPSPSPSPNALAITSVSGGNTLNAGYDGVAYSNNGASTGNFGASGGAQPYTWSATGLPPGLTMSASGTIPGTPTSAGSYAPTLMVNDTGGGSASKGFVLNITMQVSISPGAAPAGTVGVFYSQTFTATGGMPPYTWTEGLPTLLPPGITFNAATATLSGTPTTAGSYSCNVAVTDSTGQNGSSINGGFTIH